MAWVEDNIYAAIELFTLTLRGKIEFYFIPKHFKAEKNKI